MPRTRRREGEPLMPEEYAAQLPPALKEIGVPAYIIDETGRIRWLNDAAKELAGDAVGRFFTSLIAPDAVSRARATFEQNIRERRHGDYSVDVVVEGETKRVEISSVPIGDLHHAIGMFGLLRPVSGERAAPKVDDRLTPRQQQILGRLAEGASTAEIAGELVLSRETVRNHVRHILQRLGVRSRLAAIAVARNDGLV
jgi:DNA-binding CsgD family transcriptional regulator